MPRPQKDPLRLLTTEEKVALERLRRAQTDPAACVARATVLLAVAAGQSYTDAARAAGRKSGDAVAHLVTRFNRAGLAAIQPGHGGGQPKRYRAAEAARILREVHRAPDRDADGTGYLVARHPPTGAAAGTRRAANDQYRHHRVRVA